MPLDYGVQKRPRRGVLFVAGAVLVALAVVALMFVWSSDRATRMAHARAWTQVGPPCPTASLVVPLPAQAVAFDGVTFARDHGAIRCDEIGYKAGRSSDLFPVCQFDHPGRLVITAPHGVAAFDLPPLDGATVSIKHGVASCVVGNSLAVD